MTAPELDPRFLKGTPKPRLTAAQMKSLYAYFTAVADPRVARGKRHQLATILALAAAAELCGARGFTDIHQWVATLSAQKLRSFHCRVANNTVIAPSHDRIRVVWHQIDHTVRETILTQWKIDHHWND
ncbi:MAG: transposase family protein [Aestuariivita sp.]|nr:transposase family protein [Aestuariivita sp.]MCY4347399.1 transposase family protein [Aestuariivita sp.]